MVDEKIIFEAIRKIKQEKKRGFKQTVDLIVNLKNLDMKKPESKIKTEIFLPKGTGKECKVGIFADSLIPKAKEAKGVELIRKDEIETIGKDKKRAKKIAEECKFFLSEAALMPSIGKFWGQVLAVRNKMPKPIPPTIPNLAPMIERTKNTIKVALKDSPIIQCNIGTEDMDEKDIAENIEAILKALEISLPKGKENIKNICLKLTMGKPEKIIIK